MRAFPQLTSKKQVRPFLGLTGYYRKFIPEYATIAVPLTDLTRKSSPNRVVWTHECTRAFEDLKNCLFTTPALHSPDFTKPFILQTDASERGIGAVLSQHDTDGTDHLVSYYSCKLLKREEKYTTVEKECLAISDAINAFKVFLLG